MSLAPPLVVGSEIAKPAYCGLGLSAPTPSPVPFTGGKGARLPGVSTTKAKPSPVCAPLPITLKVKVVEKPPCTLTTPAYQSAPLVLVWPSLVRSSAVKFWLGWLLPAIARLPSALLLIEGKLKLIAGGALSVVAWMYGPKLKTVLGPKCVNRPLTCAASDCPCTPAFGITCVKIGVAAMICRPSCPVMLADSPCVARVTVLNCGLASAPTVMLTSASVPSVTVMVLTETPWPKLAVVTPCAQCVSWPVTWRVSVWPCSALAGFKLVMTAGPGWTHNAFG